MNQRPPYNSTRLPLPPQGAFPMGPMMPPSLRKPNGWKARILGRMLPNGLYVIGDRNKNFVPLWLMTRTMLVYIVVLLIVSMLWPRYMMPAEFIAISISLLMLFCYPAYSLSYSWRNVNDRVFRKKLFSVSIVIRLLFVAYTYIHNISYFGTPIGDQADTVFFITLGKEIENGITHFDFAAPRAYLRNGSLSFDDLAYPITLGIVYLLTGEISDVLIPFIYKAFMGAYLVLMIFDIANRHFGTNVARIASVLCMLNPNMIWWGATMMKEADMMFFTVLFVNIMDKTLWGTQKFSVESIIPAALIGMWVFLYRAALGAVCFMALMFTIVLASNRVIPNGKKIIVGVLVALVVGLGMGPRMFSDTHKMVENVQEGGQQVNMEWRSKRAGGNTFAKYAGATVFAPLIFTIPFPTLTAANPDQYSQMQMSSGNFIKNVLSFFVIMSMIVLLLTGEWRKHVFPISFTLGYLFVLVMSGYEQSGRFHMPIWPFEMMFAAYGICVLPRQQKRWFNYVLVFEVLICIAWNWFKLKGRGMI